MKTINYEPSVSNLSDYYNIINNSSYDGIFINVVLETDYKIKLYIPDINNFFEIEEFLEAFKNYKKLIIINMLLGYIFLNETNSKKVSEINYFYVTKLKETLKKYPNNLFNISTFNESILYFLKTTYIPYEIGVVVTRFDLNFKDVNFYIFSEQYIIEILEMLLSNNKKIMIFENTSGPQKSLPPNILNQIYCIKS